MAQKAFQEDIIQPTHMDKRDENKQPKMCDVNSNI